MVAEADKQVLAEVTFPYDRADLVDATVRGLAGQAAVHRSRWRFTFLCAFVAGLIVFVLFLERPLTQRLTAALTGYVAIGALAYWQWRAVLVRRIRRYVDASWGAGPHVFRVRLDERSCRVQSPKAELRHPWARCRAVREVGADIELWFDTLTVVRGRAFASPSERAAFLRRAMELANGAADEDHHG